MTISQDDTYVSTVGPLINVGTLYLRVSLILLYHSEQRVLGIRWDLSSDQHVINLVSGNIPVYNEEEHHKPGW